MNDASKIPTTGVVFEGRVSRRCENCSVCVRKSLWCCSFSTTTLPKRRRVLAVYVETYGKSTYSKLRRKTSYPTKSRGARKVVRDETTTPTRNAGTLCRENENDRWSVNGLPTADTIGTTTPEDSESVQKSRAT